MEEYIVKILSVSDVTHDVKCLRLERPEDYMFISGQATDISINTPELRNEKRAFTFTSINSDPYLEFTIKCYPQRESITNLLHRLKAGDEVILHEVFGDISYKGEGVFIAGGAGITPFLSIFRELRSKHAVGQNILIFANKTKADIVREDELRELLGDKFINILSDEKIDGYPHGFISEDFLKTIIKDINKMFYLCGPPPMMDVMGKIFSHLHVDENLIVRETI